MVIFILFRWVAAILGGLLLVQLALLAFIRQSPSEARLLADSDFWDFESDIHLRIPTTQHKFNLTRHPGLDTQPVWSPDGQWIAFASDRERQRGGRGKNSAYIIHPNGTDLRKIGTTSPATGTRVISWSPTGEWLYLKYITQGWWDNYFVRVADGHTTTLRFANTFNLYASWSPTGEWLAYRTGLFDDISTSLAIARPGDEPIVSEVKTLVTSNDYIDYLLWSPDGQWIAFTSLNRNTLAEFSLYRVTVHGDNLKLLHTSSKPYLNLAWSPDSRQLAFILDQTPHLYQVDLEGEQVEELTTDSLPYKRLAWSPDGQWIAFAIQDGQVSALYKMAVDDRRAVWLHDIAAPINRIIWSEDGRWLYFDTDAREQSHFYRIRPDGSEVEYLTETAFDWDIPLSPVIDLPWQAGSLALIAVFLLASAWGFGYYSSGASAQIVTPYKYFQENRT